MLAAEGHGGRIYITRRQREGGQRAREKREAAQRLLCALLRLPILGSLPLRFATRGARHCWATVAFAGEPHRRVCDRRLCKDDCAGQQRSSQLAFSSQGASRKEPGGQTLSARRHSGHSSSSDKPASIKIARRTAQIAWAAAHLILRPLLRPASHLPPSPPFSRQSSPPPVLLSPSSCLPSR